MPRKRSVQPKARPRGEPKPNHDAPDLMPPVDFAGYSVRVVENNDLPDHWQGVTWPEAHLIEVRTRHKNGAPIAKRSLLDVLLHEFGHGGLGATGGAARLRKRLKMTAKQWDAFEEALVVEYTIAILGPLLDAGLLVFPRLPETRRHRTR